MASWDHISEEYSVFLFNISAFCSFFIIESVPPNFSHIYDLISFVPFLYLPIIQCERSKSDHLEMNSCIV